MPIYSHNLFSCFYLLFYLVFQPSKWRCIVAEIAPDLAPGFTLSDLKPAHWRQAEMRHLLFVAYIIGPFYVGIISGLWLLLSGSIEIALRGFVYSMTISLVGGIFGGIIVSFAFSVVAALLGGMLIGFLYQLAPVWSLIAGLTALGMASHVLVSLSTLNSKVNQENEKIRLANIQIHSVVFSNINFFLQHIRCISLKQIIAVVLGLFSTAGIIFITAFIFHTLLFRFFPNSLILWATGTALGVGLAFALYTRLWWTAVLLAGTFALGIVTLLSQAEVIADFFLLQPLAGGLMNGLLFPVLFGLPYLLTRGMADNWSGIVAGLLGSAGVYLLVMLFTGQPVGHALLGSIAGFTLGLTYHWWKSPLFYLLQMPYNQFLYRAEQHHDEGNLLSHHSAYWDEHQWLPLYGLDKHLVLVAERDSQAAEAAFAYLNKTPQYWAVLNAQLELFIRALERCQSLAAIKTVHHYLPMPPETLQNHLIRFSKLSDAIEQSLSASDKPIQCQSLETDMDVAGLLLKDLTHVQHAESLRLCRIVEHWRSLLNDQVRDLSQRIEQNRPFKNPYITGVPLTTAITGVFVGRRDIATQIEQLLQAVYAPPILLLGQRRMGKTSLLNHLEHFLSHDYVPVVLDLQGISAANPAAFFYNISRIVTRSARQSGRLVLPDINREMFQREPVTDFNEWLDSVEDALSGQTLLLAFDELESLELAFVEGSLERNMILGSLRHIIQHRPHFKILLTGAYLSPDWASYLINVETLRLGYLQAEEARELIVLPVRHKLSYHEAAIKKILALTHGHPALLQYLCKAIVIVKNRQEAEIKNKVSAVDVEAAIPMALQSASQFLIYLGHAQGELGRKVLQFIARQVEQQATLDLVHLREIPFASENLQACLTHLKQQDILEEPVAQEYCFQVELIRHWFLTQ
ncbi:hypothetical protein [Candidatus Venteria ishoeyi]|uniref:Archaeal ATPase n=1 Tax=Candidatus Venteria ishoeyi TaxID=1899563 RepID=A0A1H6FA53_9GAMM|nr:hypothetical protein [Candidatus Venteria ishoeyi]SEH06990.1 Archaeal ATPase [Candidatus Venteria ishoeyi]